MEAGVQPAFLSFTHNLYSRSYMAGVKTLLRSSSRSTTWRIDLPSQPTAFVAKEFSLSSGDNTLEIHIHEKLSGTPGIVRCFGSSYEGKPRLLTEYCARGSVRSFIEERKEPLSEAELLSLYSQMARTMRLLRGQKVAHRAISAENWLITADMQAKLNDFGHAKDFSSVQMPGSSEKSSERLFLEDALRLSRVFYQMATCDFRAQVLSMSATAVKRACEERGYSRRVSNAICHFLCLRSHPYPEQFQDLETLDLDAEMTFPAEEEAVDHNYCSVCVNGRPARLFVECEHRICDPCEREIRARRGRLLCELCGNTFSVPQPTRTEPNREYDFSNVDFDRLM